MNILFVASSSDWHIDLWVKYFTKSHNVYLFSDQERHLNKQQFNNVTIIEYEGYLGKLLNYFKINSHSFFQINKFISSRYFASAIDSTIKKFDIDIVHAHSLYYGYLSSYIRSEVPIVFTPMGSDVIIHAQKSFIYRYMAKKAFKRAYIVTGDSFLLQKCGYQVGASRTRNYVIQNGVDSSVFFPKPNQLKSTYKVAFNETLLFSPRAIVPLYNIDIIIEAIFELKKCGYRVKCMFAFAFGNEYSNLLKNKIKALELDNDIIWLGFLSYKEMAAHYNAADIVLSVPSSDSSPKSVYEAMFCKKPVIVSDLEWSYELLANSRCLKRVKVSDSFHLSETIKDLIDSSEKRNEMSLNALNQASKEFDYEKNMKKMEKIMLKAVEGNL